MKEKRYFYDSMMTDTPDSQFFNHFAKCFSIGTFILLSIVYTLSYKDVYDGVNTYYSSSTYEYLEEIANNTIIEGSGFDLAAIPQDVSRYNITYEDDTIEFNYSLKSNENFQYTPTAKMTIILSKDFEILEKNSVYISEESYKRYTKDYIYSMTFIRMLFGFAYTLLLELICIIIGIIISYFHKRREQKNLPQQ